MDPVVVVDTNIVSAYIGGDYSVKDVITGATTIYIPFIVMGELYHGYTYGSRYQENVAVLKAFLRSPRVELLHPTEHTSMIYGEIMAELKKAGKPMQTNDVWIAALCKEKSLPLFTKDQGFRNIVGLQLLDN